MLGRFKRDTRRTVQLGNHDAFRAVDHERTLRGHEGQFAHENFFFLDALFFLQLEGDVQGGAIGRAFTEAFEPVHLRFADFVGGIVEFNLLVIAPDRKHFPENRFQSNVFLTLRGRNFGLQKFRVGIRLQLDHVRRRDDFLDFAEINTFCGSRWHFLLSFWRSDTLHRYIYT